VNDIALPTKQDARALTDRIKVAVEGTWLLIQEAYTSRAWAALGYDTWDSYCAAEFGTARLRLPREERQEVVASLRESGMSLRAISSATGISPATAMRDARVSDETPAVILGTDGGTYAAARPNTEPPSDDDLLNGHEWTQPDGPGFEAAVTPPAAAPKPKRRPLPEAITEASRDYVRAAERLARLTEDDRFPKNRDTTQLPELLGALDTTARFVQALRLDQTAASEEARRWWATSLHKISDALADVANSIEQEQ
jgi:hypothetical protein